MGNNQSGINDPDKLYKDTKKTIDDLIYHYKIWSDESICNNLSIVYHDKLIKFNKDGLLDVSAAVGYSYKKDFPKDKLCKLIIEHFQKKMLLLNKIDKGLKIVRERILQAQSGPVCRNIDTHVDNFLLCEKLPGVWLNEEQYKQSLNNLKETGRYNNYLKYLYDLQNVYEENLIKLEKVVNLVKNDQNNSMSDNKLDELLRYTNQIIENLDTLSEIYYLMLINYS